MKPIDSLTPEELRVECAESRGFVQHAGNARWVSPDGSLVYMTELPPVDTDANAALTLADSLAEDGWTHEHEGRGDAVAFTFSKSASIHRKAAYGPHAFPLALSRAYLAVIRSTKNAQ